MRTCNQNKSIFLWEISPDLMKLFYHYDWPGNVRELENIILGSVIFVDNQERFLKIEHIPQHIRGNLLGDAEQKNLVLHSHSLKESVADFEKNLILETIFAVRGNISQAAKALGVTRQNLYFKIDKYNLRDYLNEKRV